MAKNDTIKKMNCSYCGSSWNQTEEHHVAKVKGGVATIPACATCNQSKGKKAFMEWLRWLRDTPEKSYRWNKIKTFQKGKSSDIAKKVQKVRDENLKKDK